MNQLISVVECFRPFYSCIKKLIQLIRFLSKYNPASKTTWTNFCISLCSLLCFGPCDTENWHCLLYITHHITLFTVLLFLSSGVLSLSRDIRESNIESHQIISIREYSYLNLICLHRSIWIWIQLAGFLAFWAMNDLGCVWPLHYQSSIWYSLVQTMNDKA